MIYILVLVDFSEPSANALEVGAKTAKQQKANITRATYARTFRGSAYQRRTTGILRGKILHGPRLKTIHDVSGQTVFKRHQNTCNSAEL